MKRLALLAVTAFMAVVLSACGDNAEKKMEDQAAPAEQTQEAAPAAAEAPAATDAAAPASSEAAPAAEENKSAQ